MRRLAEQDVPEWRREPRDRVRAVVGSFEGVQSPMVPAEAFDLLDAELRRTIRFCLRKEHVARLYAVGGSVVVRAGGLVQTMGSEQVLALLGDSGRVILEAADSAAHVPIMSGAASRGRVVMENPHVMIDRRQIEAVVARYHSGEIGQLTPLAQ